MANTSLPPLDPIPESVTRLIRLYQANADALKFPDVDAESLAASVEGLDAQIAAVEEARAALEEAREKVIVAHQQALDMARRAHAYASIFALADEEMQEELSQIKLAAPQKPPKKRKTVTRSPRTAKKDEASSEEEPGALEGDKSEVSYSGSTGEAAASPTEISQATSAENQQGKAKEKSIASEAAPQG